MVIRLFFTMEKFTVGQEKIIPLSLSTPWIFTISPLVPGPRVRQEGRHGYGADQFSTTAKSTVGQETIAVVRL